MTHEDLNPFAAPASRNELARDGDWKLTELRKGLRLWLASLCVGISVQLLKTFVGLTFGMNTNGVWYVIYSVVVLASLLNKFVCIAASLNVFRAAPPVAAQRLAAIVLLFIMIAPIVAIALPITSRIVPVDVYTWMQIGKNISAVVCSISFLILLRKIAAHFEQQDAYGIAGLVICLELGLGTLPVAFAVAGAPMQSMGDLSTMYLLCTVGVLFVKGIVVYLLVSHLRVMAGSKHTTSRPSEKRSVPSPENFTS